MSNLILKVWEFDSSKPSTLSKFDVQLHCEDMAEYLEAKYLEECASQEAVNMAEFKNEWGE
jgi:hypothetical protein